MLCGARACRHRVAIEPRVAMMRPNCGLWTCINMLCPDAVPYKNQRAAVLQTHSFAAAMGWGAMLPRPILNKYLLSFILGPCLLLFINVGFCHLLDEFARKRKGNK